MVCDALVKVFQAHVEWNGVLVWGQVGSGAIAASAVEVESILFALVPSSSICASREVLTASQSLAEAAPPQTSGQVLRSPWHHAPAMSV